LAGQVEAMEASTPDGREKKVSHGIAHRVTEDGLG